MSYAQTCTFVCIWCTAFVLSKEFVWLCVSLIFYLHACTRHVHSGTQEIDSKRDTNRDQTKFNSRPLKILREIPTVKQNDQSPMFLKTTTTKNALAAERCIHSNTIAQPV